MAAWQLVEGGALRITGDDIFFSLTDRTHAQWLKHGVMDAVNAAARHLMEGLMARGLSVVADRTHLSRASRAPVIAMAAAHGFRVEVLLWQNFEVAQKRNAARTGRDQVPEAIWQSMAKGYQRPSQEEGIDAIHIMAS